MKKSLKKSLFLLSICFISVLITSIPSFGNAATTAPFNVTFAPELVVGSNFTWKVNEWLDMDDWLNPDSIYIPTPGDLWFMEIVQAPPPLKLDGSVSGNISEWFYVDIEASLDVEEAFEYNIWGNTFLDTFGKVGDKSHNWKMVNRLFLLPHKVGEQYFADFYGNKLESAGYAYDTDINGDSISIKGSITSGEYQEDTFEINATVGLIDDFVYKKKPFGHEAWKNIVNISLVESYIPDPQPIIPGYTYIIGFGSIFVGIIAFIVHRKIIKKNK